MKTFISIILVSLGVSSLSVCISPALQKHKTLDTIISDGSLQNIENDKNTECEHFSVPTGISQDNVEFKEDGKVYVQLGKSNQTFDITDLQQMHRLSGLKKIIQSGR